MKKLIAFIGLLFLTITTFAQTYVGVGNALQRAATIHGYIYRFSLGVPGYMNIYTREQIDSAINAHTVDLSGLVPYTGATGNVNLGNHSITAQTGINFASGNSITGSANLIFNSVDYISFNRQSLGGEVFKMGVASGGIYNESILELKSDVAPTTNTGVVRLQDLNSTLTGYVPYTGATTDVSLGVHGLATAGITLNTSGHSLQMDATGFTDGGGTFMSFSNGNYVVKAHEHQFLDIDNTVYAEFGNGSNGPLSHITHLKVDNAPGAPTDVVRLSDLTGYTGFVPYTGATANVDLGSHDFTSRNINATLVSVGTFSSGISIGGGGISGNDGTGAASWSLRDGGISKAQLIFFNSNGNDGMGTYTFGMNFIRTPGSEEFDFGRFPTYNWAKIDSTGIYSLGNKVLTTSDTATYIKRTVGVIHLASIAQMQPYTGTATTVIITADSLRGGTFNYVASGLVADGGVVISRTSGGYWQRQYDVSKGVNISWWGNTTASWKAAIKYAGQGGTVNAIHKYIYPQTDEIIPLLNQTINGNGATLQRQHESSVLNTVIVNSTDFTITVASIPSTWKVGDFLQIWVTQSSVGCTLRNKITNISGNVVTLQYAVGTGQYNSQTSWAIGTANVRKVFHQITNPINTAASTNGETLTGTWTINNLIFDGQSSINSENVYWGVNNAIFGQGINQQIINCKFYNMPNDNIGGHGHYINNFYAYNLNNSFYHVSANFLFTPLQVPFDISVGQVINSNQILSSTGSMHSEGAITLSFTSGYGQIHNVTFKGGLDAVIGNIAWATDPKSGATKYFDFFDNHCYNYAGIIAGFSTGTGGLINPGVIHIMGNTFSNCGTTAPFPATNANVGPFIWDANILSDGTTITVPMWAHNTGDNIINSTGGLAQQTGAINISGTIASGAITSTGAVNATSVVSSGGVSGTTGTFTSDVTMGSGSAGTFASNYVFSGFGQTGSSLSTAKAKFDASGVAFSALSSSGGFYANGPGSVSGSATRPAFGGHRGSNAYPEFAFREALTANTGFDLMAGPGTQVPTIVAQGIYNATKSSFQIPSGVNFNINDLSNVNGILYTNAGLVSQTAQGAANTVLHGNGASAPTFSKVDLTADITGFQINNITAKTANYTVVSGDFVAGKKSVLDLPVDATSGNVTITLPSASTFAGYEVNVIKTDATANTVTVVTSLGNNVFTKQYQGALCSSNSAAWYARGYNSANTIGQIALTAGVAAISIPSVSTSTRAFVTFVSIGGTVSTTWQYKAVCTAGTLTITAITNTGTTDTTDTSTLNYQVIN